MKKLTLLLILVFLSATLAEAQENREGKGRFGVAINSSLEGVIGEVSIAPTGSFYIKKHQIELGFVLYPWNMRYPRMLGSSLGYKYYPNGIDKRFSLYFNVNVNYTNEFIDHQYIVNNYQSNYNYLSFMGGSGFQFKFLNDAYIGMNLNFGVNTSSVNANPPQYPYSRPLFDSYELDGALRVNIGYRFKW